MNDELTRDERDVLEKLVLCTLTGGLASAYAVAGLRGCTMHTARYYLARLEGAGLVRRHPAAVWAAWLNRDVDGWSPTAEGKALVPTSELPS